MSETPLQRNIILRLRYEGFYVIRVVISDKTGTSDIVACSPQGRFWCIEVKDSEKKPRPDQLAKINEVTKRNGVAFWCDSYESFMSEFMLRS